MTKEKIYTYRQRLDTRELSAVTLIEQYLAAIERLEPSVGAYLTLCADHAIEQAKKADALLDMRFHTDADKREPMPLLGIPYACKDNLVTAGIRTTCASRMLAHFVPPYSATAVERMEQAGAILLGKTNMDEFAMGSDCEHSALGQTKNPLDLTRSPGGSSGGSAAAVAAGEAAFALGTDTGGSARQPASFCGLVAMKPTYGLVPRYGLVEFASSMDTICPMTQTVEENRMVLSALAGHDLRDMTSLQLPEKWYEELRTASLEMETFPKRIAVAKGWDVQVDSATAYNTARVIKRLEENGCLVEEVALPENALEVYVILTAAESSSNLARYDGIRYGTPGEGDSYRAIGANARTNGFGEEVTRRILTGTYALSKAHGGEYFHKIKAVQQDIIRKVESILETYEAILMPTTGSVAFPLAKDGEYVDRYDSDRFTIYANLTGLPAIQLPSGREDTTGGLPTGVSFLGRRYSELALYRLAAWLEKALTTEAETEAHHAI